MTHSEKTTSQYWDSLYSGNFKLRLPSKLSVGSRNLQRLLGNYICAGMRVMEIGCAPGRHLAYVAKHLKAHVSGLDYSKKGIAVSRKLFNSQGITGDLRCEDIFSTSFVNDNLDVVYSLGVIEHFNDPTDIVRRHVLLLKQGGTALIVIPNYSGFYGRLQEYFDPENLLIHNMDIMHTKVLTRLTPTDLRVEAEAFPYGRLSPWLINLSSKWPEIPARAISYFLNFIGLLQPFDIPFLCPIFVLKIKRM